MKILIVENYPGTPIGIVGEALAEAGAETSHVVAHAGEPLPEHPDGFAGMVMLGGAQSALDDDDYPHLPGLVRLTRVFGDAGKAVLGICLGAQIIARAYGGENILSRPVEFGYRPVSPLPEAAADPVLSALAEPTPTFHWHQDTVTLPPGAVRLAESEMTPIQAFRIGRKVYAVQFHFEASGRIVSDWSVSFAGHIAAHTPDWPQRVAAEVAAHASAADALGRELARRWVRLAME
ncbi:GMP synthase-like glutamine amidotransferase [Tepidamorphus gemmatus]|jgi:GMP synthase (glutamine-hydrolysing)|uniref:GMP synthase-like glutamine amidotransferase n=1 Tax=Tepidamorphus gemmatus TaxID=747076 RepID=A0A4R3M9U8_9HYPH|nr:type 1 glutamine amidotransferase [Tepidamorphus gemmatus]TCT09986.1 GMP synthase-like glutamine amidotransferase [Tepidamorphus gemmatus]